MKSRDSVESSEAAFHPLGLAPSVCSFFHPESLDLKSLNSGVPMQVTRKRGMTLDCMSVELFRSGVPNHGWTLRASSTGTGDGWTFTSSDNVDQPTFRPRLEIVSSLPLSPYDEWASAHGLISADREPLADPDQDGVNNLAEFAYNLNPSRADSHAAFPPAANGLPVGVFTSIDGESGFQVQFVRRQNFAMVGLDYSIAFSPDLIHWSPEQLAETEPLDSNWERVRVRPSSASAGNTLFCRILLTLRP